MLVLRKKPPFYDIRLRKFIAFVNKEWPVKPQIFVEILPDYTLVQVDLEEKGIEETTFTESYGVYNDKIGEILIAGGMFWPKWSVLILVWLAHEFYHVQQHIAKKAICERQADVFALKAVDLFIQEQELKHGNK